MFKYAVLTTLQKVNTAREFFGMAEDHVVTLPSILHTLQRPPFGYKNDSSRYR